MSDMISYTNDIKYDFIGILSPHIRSYVWYMISYMIYEINYEYDVILTFHRKYNLVVYDIICT